MDALHSPSTEMTQDEKAFFKALGQRIATLRKEQGLNQTQLGELLGMAQQMVASYEIGRRRVPVSLLPRLARTLGVPTETLIGEEATRGKRGPPPKLQQQMERISRLPRPKQRFMVEMLEAMIQQAGG